MNIIVINIITVFIIIVMAKSLTFPAAIRSAVIFANTAGEIVNHDVTDHIIYLVWFVLQHHDILNYLNDLLKTIIFTKLMIWH
jgi:protein gp37